MKKDSAAARGPELESHGTTHLDVQLVQLRVGERRLRRAQGRNWRSRKAHVRERDTETETKRHRDRDRETETKRQRQREDREGRTAGSGAAHGDRGGGVARWEHSSRVRAGEQPGGTTWAH
eukprot:SAG31_NODE_4016_length_3662_cov_3.395453_6_plen_121_part_00